MPHSPLVVVANRLPIDEAVLGSGAREWRRSPGGLVSALRPILHGEGTTWIGWAGGTGAGATYRSSTWGAAWAGRRAGGASSLGSASRGAPLAGWPSAAQNASKFSFGAGRADAPIAGLHLP